MHGKLTSGRAAVHNQCHDFPVSNDDIGQKLLDPSDIGPDQAGALFDVTDVVSSDIVGRANGPTS